ncbi:phosphoribosylaminoimidazole carboxylase [Erysipelothrix larvae]|uniref:N5-carboxyaminoimidazole ribonucleotide mutase n=1 Tax=Erysipelothrix larvae TaxID=1514105 RepID=A0A0X8H0L9_9FIRM|nr:5-(carboxyamino)imidazole ribonucleotide mutase [Erysipelothrix larvae]AMC93881.1 phosphoribosylaminoimidazole carboxylase [Erysipelothrix larvae]
MARVAVIMGSKSDFEVMQETCTILDQFNVEYTKTVVSAHRTPHKMVEFASEAKANGFDVIIAAAGGAAHLPGMVAAMTPLPVIGVPIQSKALNGIDSLLSIVQMPQGVPVLTMSIGKAGAMNAAYSAISILALSDEALSKQYIKYKETLANDTWEQQFR